MSTRKSFLAAAAALPLVAASPSPSASPAAAPTPKEKPPSEAARGLAARMRGFDAKLTDKELGAIAAGIDGNLDIGKALKRHQRALTNADEPATPFSVPE